MKNKNLIKLFLRLSLGAGFLSASADRLGMWPERFSAWGNWSNFLDYTQKLNPWMPEAVIPALGFTATAAEIILGLMLILGFKTKLSALSSGILLLVFALSMTFSTGIKSAFDASVFAAAAAAFALSAMDNKYLDLDTIFHKH